MLSFALIFQPTQMASFINKRIHTYSYTLMSSSYDPHPRSPYAHNRPSFIDKISETTFSLLVGVDFFFCCSSIPNPTSVNITKTKNTLTSSISKGNECYYPRRPLIDKLYLSSACKI